MAASPATGDLVEVLVLHGGARFYEKMGVARKLHDRGFRVVREHEARSANEAVLVLRKQVLPPAVVVLRSDMTAAVVDAVRGTVNSYPGSRFFFLEQRVSSDSWKRLEEFGRSRSTPTQEGVVVQLRAAEEPKCEHGTPGCRGRGDKHACGGCAEYPPASPAVSLAEKIARDVADNEQIAKLALEDAERARQDAAKWRGEAEELRGRIAALERSTSALAREQLAQDLARKEAERAEAVRQRHALERDLTERLEASETLRKKAEKLLEAAGDDRSLAKVKGERDQLAAELRKARTEIEHAREAISELVAQKSIEVAPPVPAAEDPGAVRVRKVVAAFDDGILSPAEAWEKVIGVLR